MSSDLKLLSTPRVIDSICSEQTLGGQVGTYHFLFLSFKAPVQTDKYIIQRTSKVLVLLYSAPSSMMATFLVASTRAHAFFMSSDKDIK